MDSWDHARFFLAFARAGSVRAAARSLGVSHATVSRHLAALESTMGTTLAQRTPDGYVLTEAGTQILSSAALVETELGAMARRVEGRDERLRGTVRITMPDSIVEKVSELLADFCRAHPAVTVEIAVDNRNVDLLRRAADIALRFTSAPPPDLIGRRIGSMTVAGYAATSLVGPCEQAALASLPWVRWDEAWRNAGVERWIDEQNIERIVARVDSMFALRAMVRSGAAAGLLFCRQADDEPGLRRITPVIDTLTMDLWSLTHPDLRRVRRVRSLTAHLATGFR